MEEHEYSYTKNNSDESIENLGVWIECGRNVIYCSKCSHAFLFANGIDSISEFKHCPNCKTKMKGVVDVYTITDAVENALLGKFDGSFKDSTDEKEEK